MVLKSTLPLALIGLAGSSHSTMASTSPGLDPVAQAQAVGTTCSPEGLWNCMTVSFQRCTNGAWSATMAMAPGTKCYPAGDTLEFHIGFSNSPSSAECGYSGADSTSMSVPLLTPHLPPYFTPATSVPSPYSSWPELTSTSSSTSTLPVETEVTPSATVEESWAARISALRLDTLLLLGVCVGVLVGQF
ncbi:uncharacterized protein BROUX77_000331 [Berkeleyomyces rouxiae]|uniref:uncharacterized protein n=1 Tax=Berkeleyomyces rouxiae TaxID=2035830 RepID=UPI003B78FE2F